VLVALSECDAATTARVGPKAATLARLRRAGLPVPDGFVLDADAYRAHVAPARVDPSDDERPRALRRRLACLRDPLDPAIVESLVAAWERLAGAEGALVAVRSSALLEDSTAASFAGQFETFLGIADARDLVTAVRACWASLWSARALRYLGDRGLDPATTAMAVLVQRLVPARAAGGALSRMPDGGMLLTGAWGLGPTVAHGEVVPDRFRLGHDGSLAAVEAGLKDCMVACAGDGGPRARPVAPTMAAIPCLDPGEAETLGRLVRAAEAVVGAPVEVEWALDDTGFHILQARPLRLESPSAGDGAPSLGHPGLRGHPSGFGRAAGPACVVRSEGDLARVGFGAILVTRVAGPALAAVLPRVAGVVAELGGSTSHLAALARERGIPAVLGVPAATRRIPDGVQVAVDGITGGVRWTLARRREGAVITERQEEL
jgi:pyruvate,water dikinase